MTVALGVDFETIKQTPAYRGLKKTPDLPSNMLDVTDRLLSLFNRYDISVTFFIVAELTNQHPDLIRRIADEGHEIASHTVSHISLSDCSAQTRKQEIQNSKVTLESTIGQDVMGLRAPTCRISRAAYRDLINAGYRYSSSVMPTIPIPGFYEADHLFDTPTQITTSDGVIIELPLSVSARLSLPISGAWVRMLGRSYFQRNIQRLTERNLPIITYCHPWEFINLWDTPLPFRNRIRTGEWLYETYERLLQQDFDHCTVSELTDRVEMKDSYLQTHDEK